MLMNIVTYNVAGLRGLLRKNENALKELRSVTNADVICLQETKLSQEHIKTVEQYIPEGWIAIWSCTEKRKGFNGVSVMMKSELYSQVSKIEKMFYGEPTEFDNEGRVIIVEFKDGLKLINVYVPNSGAQLARLDTRTRIWDTKIRNYILNELKHTKRLIVTGDFNVAHKEIDVYNPSKLAKSAGFTKEERDSFNNLLEDTGLIDSYRVLYPVSNGYTFYSYLSPKNGWRIDYFLLTKLMMDKLQDIYILSNFKGSDHLPLVLKYK